MAAILRQQFVVDPRVRGTITLYSEDPLTPNEAYLNFLAALRGLGFTVVEVGGIFKVVPEADAKLQAGTVSVDGVVAPRRPGHHPDLPPQPREREQPGAGAAAADHARTTRSTPTRATTPW